MMFAKIIVKNDYQEEGDLVFRPLVRAYKEIGAEKLIERGNAIILGVVDKEGIFHECFTGKEINNNKYVELGFGDVHQYLMGMSQEQLKLVNEKINELVFGQKSVNSNYDVQETMMEDAKDRVIEQKAYDNGLSVINPYDKENPNGYKNFAYKCSVLEILSKRNSK